MVEQGNHTGVESGGRAMTEIHPGAARVVAWMLHEGRRYTHMREFGDDMCRRVVEWHSASLRGVPRLPHRCRFPNGRKLAFSREGVVRLMSGLSLRDLDDAPQNGELTNHAGKRRFIDFGCRARLT